MQLQRADRRLTILTVSWQSPRTNLAPPCISWASGRDRVRSRGLVPSTRTGRPSDARNLAHSRAVCHHLIDNMASSWSKQRSTAGCCACIYPMSMAWSPPLPPRGVAAHPSRAQTFAHRGEYDAVLDRPTINSESQMSSESYTETSGSIQPLRLNT